tara:strand:- start:2052 stop:2810 length:759 start_codon:yes stop_codon:yes gene_type:complete
LAENKDEMVSFVDKHCPNLSGYTLIEGFPGMGLVGTIGAKYLTEKLDFKEVGCIEARVFVPIIRIHDGLPVHPSRIYINQKKKLVLLISEQIIPQLFVEKFAKEVVSWIKRKKIKRVISLSGIRAVPSKEGKEVIYGIASDNASKKTLKDFKVQLINEGITSGVTALIMLGLKDNKIEAFSLMGNVQIAADYNAASAILVKLSEILNLGLDVAPLKKEAKETEKALLEHLKQMKKTQEETTKIESDRTPMYT